MREVHRAERRAYFRPNLEAGADVHLLQAGLMCVSDQDDRNLGSFMILEAKNHEQAQRFHEGDPLTKIGLYETVFIYRWDRHVG
jgi:uncharacterized protein YciI